MPIEKLHLFFNFTKDYQKDLQRVVPEVFTDSTTNRSKLQEV
jgi:hypothetical protein